jgi:hypothetical protein
MTDRAYFEEMYMSGLNFWSDIIEIARSVTHSDKKPKKLKFIISKLKLINKHLPSFVFIPSNSKLSKTFLTEIEFSRRSRMVMSIETDQTRIFQTKTKTNFTITLQLVRQEEYLMRNNYPLSANLEKKIQQKCQKIIMKDFYNKDTPKTAFLRSSKKITKSGFAVIRQKRGSFSGTIDNMLKNSLKMKVSNLSDNFSLNMPKDGRKSHLQSKTFLRREDLPILDYEQTYETNFDEIEEEMGSFDPRKIQTAELDLDFGQLGQIGEIEEEENGNMKRINS